MNRLNLSVGASALASMAALSITFTVGSEASTQESGTVVAADPRVQGHTYVFSETGKTIPYALFVPSNYDVARMWPLIVGLHGRGRPYDWLMGYDGIIDFAQRDGYIMVTPTGYHPRGAYGYRGPGIPNNIEQTEQSTDVLPPNLGELSERDVINVVEIVRREFNVDSDRIYLWGHSMGGAGTYHLAAKYPAMWAGLAVAAPSPRYRIDSLNEFKYIPILVLHGTNDQVIPIAETRKWVSRMKDLGMQHVYVEIPGGDHSLFISKNQDTMYKLFAFFNIVRKSQRPQSN